MSEVEPVAKALGGKPAGRGYIAFCPAHDNRRTPALSISEGREGRLLVKCHRGCSGRDILAALAALGLIEGRGDWSPPDPAEEAKRTAAEAMERTRRTERAVQLWRDGRPGVGSPVQTYLVETRGIPLRAIPSPLRFHPAAPHPTGGGRVLPAMVARVDGPDGRPVGVHRTFLLPDGSDKAGIAPDKAALGPIAGGAVRLTPPGPVLAVGEGIESCLSFAVVTRAPIWAALSTSGLRGLVLPDLPAAATVLIVADNDPPGLAAAEELAERATEEGRAVRIACPPRLAMTSTISCEEVTRHDWRGCEGGGSGSKEAAREGA